MTEQSQQPQSDSGVWGDVDIVDDLQPASETPEDVAAQAGAKAESAEEQGQKEANDKKAEDESSSEDGKQPESDEAGAEGGDTDGEDEEGSEQGEGDEEKPEPGKEYRDKFSRERDKRLRVQRLLQKDLQRQIDDGVTVEDLAEAHEMDAGEIQSILEDQELSMLDSENPLQAKGQEIAQAYVSNQKLSDAYIKSQIGEGVKFEEIAYNVSVAASGDEEFRKELISAKPEDLVTLCVDKFAEMKNDDTVTSMNPMQDIRGLRDENKKLKARLAELEAKGSQRGESDKGSQEAQKTAPQKGAEATEDDRPRMSGANDLLYGEDLQSGSSVFGNM